jgi:hypothetical protein
MANHRFRVVGRRTEPEYRTLLSKAGLQMTKVVPTDSAVSIVEGMIA